MLPPHGADERRRENSRQHIGDGGGPEHPGDAAQPGADEHRRHEEDHVPGQGEQGGLDGLAGGLKEDAPRFLHAGEDDAAQENADAAVGVVVVEVIAAAEQGDDRLGHSSNTAMESTPTARTDSRTARQVCQTRFQSPAPQQ